jgi:hypothetical protein
MNKARIGGLVILLVAVSWGAVSVAQNEIRTLHRTIPEVPSATLVNGIYFVSLDAPTPYGRGYQHGAALQYVIQKGLAQWKQWINETLGQQDVEMEIAEFIHDTDYLEGIREHTPELYEELQGIAKGAGVDFQTLYAYQMFDEFVVHAVEEVSTRTLQWLWRPWTGRASEYPWAEQRPPAVLRWDAYRVAHQVSAQP